MDRRVGIGLALAALALCAVLGLASGSPATSPFVKLHQIGKVDSEVYVNRSLVMQIRLGPEKNTAVVFSTGSWIEVQGTLSEIAKELSN